jgi:hypothetical protein
MKCSTVRDRLIQRVDGHTFQAKFQRRVDKHLMSCSECQEWEALHQGFLEGLSEVRFRRVQLASPTQQIPHGAVKKSSLRQRLSARNLAWVFPIPVAVVLLLGMLMILNHSKEIRVEAYKIDGHSYQVVWLDTAATFQPPHLGGLLSPALQPPLSGGRGQLVQLDAELAAALLGSLNTDNWKRLEHALKEKKRFRLPKQQPKHLMISEALSVRLKENTLDVDIRVKQPNESILLFELEK